MKAINSEYNRTNIAGKEKRNIYLQCFLLICTPTFYTRSKESSGTDSALDSTEVNPELCHEMIADFTSDWQRT